MQEVRLPASSYLFLNKKGLTRQEDNEEYARRIRNTYKQEAYRCMYVCFLCKMYDVANLPRIRLKPLFYGPIIATVCGVSFYKAAERISDFIMDLNKKYDEQCIKFLQEER